MTLVEVERDGAIATARIQHAVAVDDRSYVAYEIRDIVAVLTDARDCSALVLRGIERLSDYPVDIETLAGAGEALDVLQDAPFPVLAVLRGPVLDEALEMALACDIRLATPDATFGLTQLRSGRLPLWGGTQRLPRIVGIAAAKTMLLTGRVIGADDALSLSLVQQVDAEVDKAAADLARAIAANSPLALRFAKEAVHRGVEMPLAAALDYEGDLYVLLESTSDRNEGIRAFRAKETPRWRGE